MTWTLINLVWTGILLAATAGLFFLHRELEHRFEELSRWQKWQEEQNRKERQL